VKTLLLTVVMLAAVFAAAFLRDDEATDRAFAEKLLSTSQVEPIPLSGPPAFRAGGRVALFFERQAMQGPIRGVVVVKDGMIQDIAVTSSREGHDHHALSADFLSSFRSLPAKPPLAVQAVSGATISSQALADAITERLKAWTAYSAAKTP